MAYTTIDDPSAHFQTDLYTGTGSELVITNDGNSDLQPDWIWIKNRTDNSTNHHAHDTSRGTTATLFLNKTDLEETQSQSVKSVQSDGFTLGTWDGNNISSKNFVAWQWKAGGGTTASNSNGSITSTVQANTTAGFSIVTYTGTGSVATVGHGLGVKPDMMILKNRDSAVNWIVYHKDTNDSANYFLRLNTTDTTQYSGGRFNGTQPTSSVFTVGTSSQTNNNGDDIVAYCFAEKQGYSKIGKYAGNENANGPFVYLGFKPAFIMIKNATVISNWRMFDNKRIGYNVANYKLLPNSASQETTDVQIDMLSNGFKIRTSDSEINSGATHIYMAFAENPFVSSGGIPTTAR
tara:strand:- start:28 stop:1074 length:1047 start_codon:yes stop_codon:yes gene_type:complete